MTSVSLKPYREQFEACVLKHIHESLPKEEWVWLREQAENQIQGIVPMQPYDHEVTPELLVATSVLEGGDCVEDVIALFEHELIDTVAGQPLYYCTRKGIYVWGLEPKEGFSLSFWITHPKYTPGW
jgi:hypothetical protein